MRADEGSWLRVATIVPAELEEVLLGALGELSLRGVEVVDHRAAPLDPTLAELPDEHVRFSLFAEAQDLEQIRAGLGGALATLVGMGLLAEPPSVVALPVAPGWRDGWKAWFKASRVTDRVVIRPSWEPWVPAPDDRVLDLDPGTAFGTGGHATTRLCLAEVDRLVGRGEVVARVLDVGTGSGVLAIAAARLGAHAVVAVDNDPEAVLVARENAARNAVDDLVQVSQTPLEQLPGTFDLVLANILAPTLLQLREALLARVRPGGRAVLSGILADEGADVQAGFEALGMVLERLDAEGEWVSLTLRRPG